MHLGFKFLTFLDLNVRSMITSVYSSNSFLTLGFEASVVSPLTLSNSKRNDMKNNINLNLVTSILSFIFSLTWLKACIAAIYYFRAVLIITVWFISMQIFLLERFDLKQMYALERKHHIIIYSENKREEVWREHVSWDLRLTD